MSATRMPLQVTYTDGQTVDVVAGQREMAKFEEQPFGCSTVEALERKPVVFLRFLAFDALRRARRLPDDDKGRPVRWEAWDDLADEVAPIDGEPGGEPDFTTSRTRPEAG